MTSLARTSSWVIREKATGAVILETFDKRKVDALNTNKYEAVPILQHLQELNAKIKAEAKVVSSNSQSSNANPPNSTGYKR